MHDVVRSVPPAPSQRRPRMLLLFLLALLAGAIAMEIVDPLPMDVGAVTVTAP